MHAPEKIIFGIVALLVTPSLAVAAAKNPALPPPTVDPNRIVNESYGFLKEREPEMTETEYALYERIIPMVTAQPDFALRLLEDMVGSEDCSAAFEFVLGNVYYEQKRTADAENRYHRATTKYPSFIRAWDNLGVLYFTGERYREAVPCFTRAIALGSSEARMHGLLAFCLLKSDRPIAAESAYMQAYALDPDNPDWIEGLLNTYLDSKQLARAETLLRQLVRLKPKESHFWLLLGNVLLTQDRKLDAIATFETAQHLGALDETGMMMLGDLYAERQFHAEAVEIYQALTKKNAALGIGRMLRYARALIAQSSLAEADKVLQGLGTIATGNDQVMLLQAKSELASARGDQAAARAALEGVLEIEPMNGTALLGLAEIMETTGDDTRALFHLEAAARIPDLAYTTNVRLANLHVKAGHYDEAARCLERSLALQRTPELQEFLARVRAMAPTP